MALTRAAPCPSDLSICEIRPTNAGSTLTSWATLEREKSCANLLLPTSRARNRSKVKGDLQTHYRISSERISRHHKTDGPANEPNQHPDQNRNSYPGRDASMADGAPAPLSCHPSPLVTVERYENTKSG